MITGPGRFNIYLLSLLAVMLACGCRTAGDGEEKLAAALRIHLEVTPDMMDFSRRVPVYRDKPVLINVDKAPFLTEVHVSEAKVVEVLGGFDLQIQFNRRGTWVLEQYTTVHPGRHLVIFSQFGEKMKQHRWLGAPAITRRISKGILTFTPDATREETELIVHGLNNVAEKVRKETAW